MCECAKSRDYPHGSPTLSAAMMSESDNSGSLLNPKWLHKSILSDYVSGKMDVCMNYYKFS